MKFLVAIGLDIVMVLVFALVGRTSHGETDSPAGVLGTAWPFVSATVLGSLIALAAWQKHAWRKPYGWRTGLIVWATTVVIGMLLRLAAGGTTAWTFWIVAAISLGILLMGWRLLARVAVRYRAARRRRA
ncbi:MAG: DUF3054 domain-containing protein [Microlunatus sp.]|nr:DUF3054 domain-containing protein [Microlunatus sp.]